MEGEEAQLNFPYPCDSTKVTLQHGYAAPFYTNPGAVSLAQNQLLINQNKTDNNNCSIHLTIKPVSRHDQGTYILTAYKNGDMVPEYPRIGLRVDYPPGKPSCHSSTEYIDRDWATLQCTAPAGTLPGQIVCYQNGGKVPPLTVPSVNSGTLYQSMLVKLAGSVVCCSSLAEHTTDRCECMDCGWDPVLDEAIADVPEPCPTVSLTESSTTISNPAKDRETSTLTSDLITEQSRETINFYSSTNCSQTWEHGVIGTLLVITIILNLLLIYRSFKKLHTNKRMECSPQTMKNKKFSAEETKFFTLSSQDERSP